MARHKVQEQDQSVVSPPPSHSQGSRRPEVAGTQSNTSVREDNTASMCFRKTKLETVMHLVLLVLLLAISVLAILTSIKLHQHLSDNDVDVTSDTAGRFSINKTSQSAYIYHTECQSWMRNNPIPKDFPSWDTFRKVYLQNMLKLSQIFENARDTQLESEAEEKAKQFYLSCNDVNETIERLGKQPIFDLIDKVGVWNISNSSSTFSSMDFQKAIQTMKNLAGVDSFFSIKVTSDNNSNYILKIALLLGADKDAVKQQMQNVFSLYKKVLTTIAQKPVQVAMTISQLQKQVSFINWMEYFQEIIPVSMKTLKSDDVLILSDLNYFLRLSKLVNVLLKTDALRILLKNFLVWRIVESKTAYLPKAFEDARREQLKKTHNRSMGRSPEYCAHLTSTYFGFATAVAFAREMYDVNSSNLVTQMFNNLKKTFTNNLNLLPLDQYNKEILKNKLDSMGLLIGFPDFIMDTDELDKYYSRVKVYENAFFTNILEAEVNDYQQQFTLLGQNAKKASWPFDRLLTPLGVNAIYWKESNQIVVPMGILQHPHLQLRQQTPFNFGTLGFLLAHEVMHAFVNRELSSEENGWPKEIQQMFQQIHSCVYKTYSNCTSVEDCKTLNEDMADISGMKLAYSAFLDWQAKQQQPTGLNINYKHQFFSTFIQLWCQNGNRITEYGHSTFMQRATKPLSYIPDFAQEFNCQPGSELNPQHRCHVF